VNFAKRRRHTGALNIPRLPLVALIDVVLFLLLYFMIGASFSEPESQLASALKGDATGRGAAANLIPQILNVERSEKGPVFRIGERIMTDRAGLVAVLTQLPKDGGVFVRVRGDVAVDAVALALQACKDSGFKKISYVPAS
jgi:biopolymer transport protein ExbD